MDKITDNYGRHINYLRISITDRCNLRCKYCMPPGGVEYKPHASILRYEEITSIVRAGVKLGINKVRITGGEPLVRKGVPRLVKMLTSIRGIEDISLTTNGVLLAEKASDLKEAGLDRVNVSLDSLQSGIYRQITGYRKLKQVLAGIDKALVSGLDPVKINTVIMKGINNNEIMDFINLCYKKPLHVRFIEYMPIGYQKQYGEEKYLSLQDTKDSLIESLGLTPASVKSNGPSETYQIPDGQGTVGFITPISREFCDSCNRLRLTADGKINPCLNSNVNVDLHDKEGNVISNRKLLFQKLLNAIRKKPASHKLYRKSSHNMFQIGG